DVTETKLTPSSKANSSAKSRSTPNIQDELEDLYVVSASAPGRRKKEVSYAVDDFIESDDEDDEGEEQDDDDSDVYTDGE
ncbi:hypothetical protein OXX80_006848, partial [Metschnikowia pulcherrima]